MINFTPFPNLETGKLFLRQLQSTDAGEMFLLRSDKRVLQYIDIKEAVTVDDAVMFIQNINNFIARNESILWAITLKDSSKVIGTICIWNIMPQDNAAEIGYMLHPTFQGKGIMQEAVFKVIDYGFNTMRLHIIDAEVDPANSASIKLLERNGFAYKTQLDGLAIYTLKSTNTV